MTSTPPPDSPKNEFEAVAGFALEVALQVSLEGISRTAMSKVAEITHADGATLFVRDQTTRDIIFRVVSGFGGQSLESMRLPHGVGVVGRVASSAEPLLVEDFESCEFGAKQIDTASGFRTGSIIACPVLVGGELVGVLEAVRRVGAPPFTAADLSLLGRLSPHVGAAVLHLELQQSLRDFNERIQTANDELERRVHERTQMIAAGKREWESTFDSIKDPIAVQEGFVLRRANTEYARAAGQKVQAVPGATCYRLLAGADEPCINCPLLNPSAKSTEVLMGSRRFEVSVYASDNEKSVVHYRDVTQAHALEAQLRDSQRLASVGQLAAGAAHEINNPLAIVTSNLNLLKEVLEETATAGRGTFTPALQESVDDGQAMLTDALSGARRIAEVVKSLVSLSRRDAGEQSWSSANQALERASLKVLGVESSATMDLRSSSAVHVVPALLEQAFEHVLRNARQAVANPGDIRVSSFDTPSDVVVVIEDRGPGIAPEILPHVFDPFFTTRKIGGGLGLGLTATWGIIRSFGGDVAIASEPNHGTRLEIRLPTSAHKGVSRSHPSFGRYAEDEKRSKGLTP